MQDSSLRNSVNHTANMTEAHCTIDQEHTQKRKDEGKKVSHSQLILSRPGTAAQGSNCSVRWVLVVGAGNEDDENPARESDRGKRNTRNESTTKEGRRWREKECDREKDRERRSS